MNGVGDLITRELWEGVAGQLEGVARSWWEDNREELLAVAVDEAEDIARALAKGDTTQAKMAIVANMSRDEWRAYVKGTTKTLQGIAINRAKLLDALEDLGMRSARVIGRALAGALGL